MSLPIPGAEAAPIRLLIVEDSELDFDLLTATLARDGPPLQARRVEDEASMREALERGPVDAVLTDHNMPRFDSFAALMRSLQAAAQRRAGRAAAAALADSEAQLRELARHLETAKEEERRRIAGEIHDDIGSTLTALRFETVALARELQQRGIDSPRVPLMLDLLGQVVGSSHRIQHKLRPPVLDAGLVAALQWLVNSFGERTGVRTRFEANRDEVELAPDRSAALYRASQEALANVSKHAQARQVAVQLFVSAEDVALEVSDDGVGFDPDLLRTAPGFGLRALIERARGLGGWAEVSSKPRGGTSLMFSIPIRGDAPAAQDD